MRVFITGFAGSLGTAFTNYCLERGDEVTGVDNNEWAVAAFPEHGRLTRVLGNFEDQGGEYDLIIHCAAYKHVDLIEQCPNGALYNNVIATSQFYRQVKGQILFISTDKAVEPASKYGDYKQRGEALTKDHNGVIARLGNIMGSSGSVIPKWEAAVANDDPLPVTDPEMTRYMIPADEAVRKIMELLPHAKADQVIVPSMGEALRLGQMVEMLYPGYPIQIIGVRAGEKTHEKLKWDDEQTVYSDDNGEIVE